VGLFGLSSGGRPPCVEFDGERGHLRELVGERHIDVVEIAVAREHRLIGLEFDILLCGAHVQTLKNLPELRRCQPAATSAISHKSGRFVGPLVVQEVQGVLE
jgi:hypothetical protein